MANPLDLLAFAKRAWDQTQQPLKERASVLPLGQYEDGSVGLAWPGILAAPAEGVANFGSQGYGEDAVPYNSRMAFDAAGGAMTGGLGLGLAGGMADNALGSAGGKLALRRGAQDNGLAQILRGEEPIGYVKYGLDGDAATIHDIKTYDGSNALGLSGLRELREAFREIAPNVKTFQGVREPTMKTGAARQGADASGYGERKQSVDLYSNAPTGAAIPLGMEGQEQDPDTAMILAALQGQQQPQPPQQRNLNPSLPGYEIRRQDRMDQGEDPLDMFRTPPERPRNPNEPDFDWDLASLYRLLDVGRSGN